eukprot:comp24215_c0_seq1/m.44535 comp24215_c0_seq1/g.44535  ORF comp24215_c0_seq1/g.44535 comp24215_c0_seq1/m.44535 type:complete len:678 (-) comp24215_c0_seq1:297-2330(-)
MDSVTQSDSEMGDMVRKAPIVKRLSRSNMDGTRYQELGISPGAVEKAISSLFQMTQNVPKGSSQNLSRRAGPLAGKPATTSPTRPRDEAPPKPQPSEYKEAPSTCTSQAQTPSPSAAPVENTTQATPRPVHVAATTGEDHHPFETLKDVDGSGHVSKRDDSCRDKTPMADSETQTEPVVVRDASAKVTRPPLPVQPPPLLAPPGTQPSVAASDCKQAQGDADTVTSASSDSQSEAVCTERAPEFAEEPISEPEQLPILETVYFNIMVIGGTGTGKSTLINRLRPATGAQQTNFGSIRAQTSEAEWVEGDTVYKVCFWEHNPTETGGEEETGQFLREQHEECMRRQYAAIFGQAGCGEWVDPRIHACIYLLPFAPEGSTVWGSMTDRDRHAVRTVSAHCPVIPLLAKADALSPDQRGVFRKKGVATLNADGVTPFTLSESAGPEPIAVSTSAQSLTVNGVKMGPEHTGSLSMLRDHLLRGQMEHLIGTAVGTHYEQHRRASRHRYALQFEEEVKASLVQRIQHLVDNAEICLRAAADAERYREKLENAEAENEHLRSKGLNGPMVNIDETSNQAGEDSPTTGRNLRSFAQYKSAHRQAVKVDSRSQPQGDQGGAGSDLPSGSSASSSMSASNKDGQKMDAALMKELLQAKYATIGHSGERYNPLAGRRKRTQLPGAKE